MKKYLIISTVSLMALGSCTKDISRFNEETKRPAIVPGETLFSNAVRTLVDGLASPNVNTNVFRFTVQHWAATTYQDEPNYDFGTRNIPQAWWNRMYATVLADLKESKRITTENSVLTEEVRKNQLAIIDIMEVYTYHVLVNSFGNIPYSQALDFNNVAPAYDDAKTVHLDLLTRLNADLANLDADAAGFTSSADFFYKGDVSEWVKFANSLKIRLGMILADVDESTAKGAVESGADNPIASAADNAEFQYLAATPNTNPIWVDLVQSGRADMVAAASLLDKMVAMDDPRLESYFAPNNNGEYVGGVVGANNTYATTARPSEKMTDPSFPALVLDYVETEFYLAEAAAREWNVEGSAAEHYHNAIKASIIYWTGDEDAAEDYVARPDVNWATAAGDWRQKIGFQKWIALYNRPFTGWLELRRLDQPVLGAPASPRSGFPNRLTYPVAEQQVNGENYTAAASAIGSDEVETKLFWDVR